MRKLDGSWCPTETLEETLYAGLQFLGILLLNKLLFQI